MRIITDQGGFRDWLWNCTPDAVVDAIEQVYLFAKPRTGLRRKYEALDSMQHVIRGELGEED